MKFLIYGNSPEAGTGYGVQISHLCRRLLADGHQVAVACTWGHQCGVKTHRFPEGDVILYPQGVLTNSQDILLAHAMHFFEGDPKAGWIVPVTDQWILGGMPLHEFQVLAWTPVDHFPAPPEVIQFFHRSGARPVAMSRFGERMLVEAGLDPRHAPLAVDTTVFKPSPTVRIAGVDRPGRELFAIPDAAFVVLMVAMNKDPLDRKGFNEAFRAFGAFWRQHQDAVLVVHSGKDGSYGSMIDLEVLARHAAIPPHALVFTEQYAQRIGFTAEMLAGLYSTADVYLAPSHGEGFCVPLVEAQACGVPVIASDFSAQTELVGAGWTVHGQLWWDAAQQASYFVPFVVDIVDKLCVAYDKRGELAEEAIAFAAGYDVERVWVEHWRPVLAELEPKTIAADKPKMESVDVIVPLIRGDNRGRLLDSFDATSPARGNLISGDHGKTYAQNVNDCLARSTADWVLIVGDDVEFTPGWFEAARELSDRYDVIGTNDSEEGRIRNPKVANGSHADHFFVRRSYIEEWGASLDGPGVLMPECYGHFWTDVEVIELAKARGMYGHAHACRLIHHHPGFDGREDLRETDPIYMKAVETSEADRKTWMSRLPLVQAQRVS